MFPESRLCFHADSSWFQSWSQNMDYGDRHQIGGAGNEKRNHVAAGPLQNIAHDFGDEHPADRARHSPYPDDRGHSSRRKQIGSQSEKIRGEALMSRGGETNQQDRRPQSGHAISVHDGDDADRAQEHGDLATCVHGTPPPDQERRQPSSSDAASQAKPSEPIMTKVQRHPSWSVIHGTNSPGRITPTFVPALNIPVASARSFAGNHSATALMLAGNTPASPKPSADRAMRKLESELPSA